MKKRIHKKIKVDQKRIAIFTGIVFFISLIPILYLSGYVHANGDDYGYGARTHQIWSSTHSVWQVLKTAGQTVKQYWIGWKIMQKSIRKSMRMYGRMLFITIVRTEIWKLQLPYMIWVHKIKSTFNRDTICTPVFFLHISDVSFDCVPIFGILQ